MSNAYAVTKSRTVLEDIDVHNIDITKYFSDLDVVFLVL